MIKVNQLTREFNLKNGFFKKTKAKKLAVDNLSFTIKKGETFALLGPNGAGKTTTIKILSTLLAPTSGICKVLGYDTFQQAKKIRGHINFIFGGESGVYKRITARENMEYFASLYEIKKTEKRIRIDSLLKLVNLWDVQNQKVETYSKGMIQRLQIARGLLNDPEVIFMDEPTIGLDPIGARDLRNIIFELKKQGKTILLTTHDMNEADILSDRIAIIHHGKIIALDTSINLKKKFMQENVLEVNIKNPVKNYTKTIQQLPFVKYVRFEQREYRDYYCIQYEGIKNHIKEILTSFDDEIESIQERGTQLEDVYIRLIEENIYEK